MKIDMNVMQYGQWAQQEVWKENIKMDLVFPLTSEVSQRVYLHGAQPQTDQGPSHMMTT
jgi:hypothetical protein